MSSITFPMYSMVSLSGLSVVMSTPAAFAIPTESCVEPSANALSHLSAAGFPSSTIILDTCVPIVSPAEYVYGYNPM